MLSALCKLVSSAQRQDLPSSLANGNQCCPSKCSWSWSWSLFIAPHVSYIFSFSPTRLNKPSRPKTNCRLESSWSCSLSLVNGTLSLAHKIRILEVHRAWAWTRIHTISIFFFLSPAMNLHLVSTLCVLLLSLAISCANVSIVPTYSFALLYI